MASDALLMRRIEHSADPLFADLVRIYTEAHPASERKRPALLAQMIEQPKYLFLVAIEAESVVGFAIALAFQDADAGLLEYMAVDARYRSQGIGRELFIAVTEQEAFAKRFLLAEVDSDKQPSEERAERTRRKGFYRRLGCREVEGLQYLMPPVSAATPPPMDLFVYRKGLPEAVQRGEIQRWLESIYSEVYGLGVDDPRIASMVVSLPLQPRLL